MTSSRCFPGNNWPGWLDIRKNVSRETFFKVRTIFANLLKHVSIMILDEDTADNHKVIQVDMEHRNVSLVFIHQSEAWTSNVFIWGNAQTPSNALSESGFSGPEIPKEKDRITGHQVSADFLS